MIKVSLKTAKKIIFLGVSLLIIISLIINLTRPIEWPNKFSNINGWKGIVLKKGIQCPVCYTLIFPNNFGFQNNQEFSILVNLPRKKISSDIKYDLDGPVFADTDILDHLLHLAIEKKYVKAAKVILYPEEYNFLIGAETSEYLIEKYIIPLLSNFDNLNALLDDSEYKTIARWIARQSRFENDFQKADQLIQVLKQKNYKTFSKIIEQECNIEKKSLEKYGE